MTKFETVKRLFNQFAMRHNDARIDISVKENGDNDLQSIALNLKCRNRIEDVTLNIYFSAVRKKPSLCTMIALKNVDYIIKDLSLSTFSASNIKALMESLLNAVLWEAECKLSTEKQIEKRERLEKIEKFNNK